MICTGIKIDVGGYRTLAFIQPFIGLTVRCLMDGKNYVVKGVNLSERTMRAERDGEIINTSYRQGFWVAKEEELT